MKKFCYLFILSLCLIFFQAGCWGNASAKLNVAEIKRDGEFIWPGLEYGMTVVEAEKASGYQIQEVPYSSSYGERTSTKYDGTEPAIDYRANPDFKYAEFFMLDQNQGIVNVEYAGAKGNLSFLFKEGDLSGVSVLWGTKDSAREPLLKFDAARNDPDAIFTSLRKELTGKYGEPEKENKDAALHSLVWTLYQNPEKTEYTTIVVSRNYYSECGDAVSLRLSKMSGT